MDDIGYWGSSNEAVEAFRATFVTKFGEDGITGGDVAETMLGMKIGYDDFELSATMSMPGFIDAMVERFERCPGIIKIYPKWRVMVVLPMSRHCWRKRSE